MFFIPPSKDGSNGDKSLYVLNLKYKITYLLCLYLQIEE